MLTSACALFYSAANKHTLSNLDEMQDGRLRVLRFTPSAPLAATACILILYRHSGEVLRMTGIDINPALVCALVLFFTIFLLRARRQLGVTGFFHPYCNDGGGGERVLW